jgi:glucose/arabinose dehydrogenase/mono/diheme cytochrome c family protein
MHKRFLATGLQVLAMIWLHAVQAAEPEGSVASKEQLARGQALYLKDCFICHQPGGQGIPGTYPPLARSDYLMSDRERSIRVICEGLSGEIVVNGRKYNNLMAPVTMPDEDVADVVTYVRNSWGNADAPVTAAEVKAARAKTQFPTYERLLAATTYAPLPAAPEGFTLREVVRMTSHGVRMASDGTGRVLYVLTEQGDVWRLEPATGNFRQMLWAKNYLDRKPGDTPSPLFVLAMAMSKDGRLYIGSNQPNQASRPYQNRVTIYRTSGVSEEGDPIEPKVWFEASYPGNSAYVHGLEHIAFGPDGMLYVGSGARTDANQGTDDPNYFNGGEIEMTSCLWRLDPKAEPPQIEVFARGLRNAYGFCWNDRGEMFATENGPDADAPEELNLIEQGKHYGFPYRFGDWTKKAYGHTPEPPAGLEFTLPIANLGPDGGFYGTPSYTFDPHSGPGGIIFLGRDFPAGWAGTLLLNRFGNFIKTPKDNVGFDLLRVTLSRNARGRYEAHIHQVLGPLGRPIDVHQSGPGKIYICEYSRPTSSAGSFALPGRILELAVKRSDP